LFEEDSNFEKELWAATVTFGLLFAISIVYLKLI